MLPLHIVLHLIVLLLQSNEALAVESAANFILAEQDQLIVKTSSGFIKGKNIWSGNEKHVKAYLGIPFAEPPIGDLRFRRPVEYKSLFQEETNPYDATQLPNACPQVFTTPFPNFTGENAYRINTEISEDCLYLNVWVPQNANGGDRVVLFWIYGGGFSDGSSSLNRFDGAILAAETGAIVVSTQYRVGPIGFLYLGIEGAPGNQGLLDQQLALQWVNKNIRNFGGNPSMVTIMGESTGAVCVCYHLISPLSLGLFRRAVVMSGAATASMTYRNPDDVFDKYVALAKKADCPEPHSPESILSCLKVADPIHLSKLQFEVKSDAIAQNSANHWEMTAVPTLDHYFLPESPSELVKKAPAADILIGVTGNEGSYFLTAHFPHIFTPFGPTPINDTELRRLALTDFEHWSDVQKEAILNQYINWENPSDGYANQMILCDLIGDAFITCPVRNFADIMSEKEGSKIYFYYFTHRTESDPRAKWMGAKHGCDVDYFFGSPLNLTSQLFTPEEQLLSQTVMFSLQKFAETGIPSQSWKTYTINSPLHVEFNVRNISTTSGDKYGPKAKSCHFWNTFMPKLHQGN